MLTRNVKKSLSKFWDDFTYQTRKDYGDEVYNLLTTTGFIAGGCIASLYHRIFNQQTSRIGYRVCKTFKWRRTQIG